MNRKIMLMLVMVLSASTFLFSAERGVKTIDIDTSGLRGKFKAGLSLGYPTGVTAGYRFSDDFEMNGTLGTIFDGVTIGGNGLFTLAKFRFKGEIFPFSMGPAVYIHSHDDADTHHEDHHHSSMDALCTARLEYSFKEIPLNLFVEGGLGLRVIEFADPAGSFAIGARYIF